MAINDNVYLNGFGATSGDDLVLDEPWYTGGVVYYLDSTDGNDSNPGTSRAQPKKTLSAGVASAGSGDFVILMPGFSEVLTSVQLVAAGVTIVGEGNSAGQPTAVIGMNSASAITLDVTGAHVEIRNVRFTTHVQTNATSKIRVGAFADCLIKGCRFEGSATDTGPLVTLNNGARPTIVDSTFIVTGTTGTANFGLTLNNAALANLTLENVAFDGGAIGWLGGVSVAGPACTIASVNFQGVTLTRGSDMLLKAASTGRINVTSNDSSRVSFV